MMKLVGTILLCVAAVIFVIQNSSPVEVLFLFGSPAKVPLVLLLLIFFIIGYVWAYLRDLKKEVRFKKKIKSLRSKLNMVHGGELEADERAAL